MKDNCKTQQSNLKETAVVVTTEHRGIFFGYAQGHLSLTADTIVLHNARMCAYYSADTHGSAGLISGGPADGSRVSPQVAEIGLRGVISIAPASDDAITAWEAEPWS